MLALIFSLFRGIELYHVTYSTSLLLIHGAAGNGRDGWLQRGVGSLEDAKPVLSARLAGRRRGAKDQSSNRAGGTLKALASFSSMTMLGLRLPASSSLR